MADECMYGCGRPGLVKNRTNSGYRCAPSPNSCPGVRAKKKQTLLDTYGVVNVSQLSSVQEKREQTWLKNYGVSNPAQAKVNQDKIRAAWPNIGKKRKQTMEGRYGVDSYSKTAEFQTRRKATWLEKYGVDNPTKNADVLHRSMVSNGKSQYRTKTLVLPSGREIQYQGFEDRVILDLLKSGTKEEDIVNDRANVPRIQYTFGGKLRSYYPDIWLPKNNQLIEVKSRYTWKKYREQNLAKYCACKAAGYNVSVAIR
jgi:hypothetical protein